MRYDPNKLAANDRALLRSSSSNAYYKPLSVSTLVYPQPPTKMPCVKPRTRLAAAWRCAIVFELKNPADASANIWKAYQQLQTYKREIPLLFETNEMLVISDGLTARLGTLTAGREAQFLEEMVNIAIGDKPLRRQPLAGGFAGCLAVQRQLRPDCGGGV